MLTRRDVLRAGVAAPLVWSVRSATAQPAPSESAWLYSDAQGPGAFRSDGKGHWTEVTPTGVPWLFREIGRNSSSIELRDDRRGLRLRLHAGYGEWLREPANVWHRWLAGRWVSPDALPPLVDYQIRLAYFIPSDRAPTPYYEDKIAVLASFVSEIYRQSLQARGYKARSLPFLMRAGKPAVALIRAARPAAYYSNAPNYEHDTSAHYKRIAADIPPWVGAPQKQLIIVLTESYSEEPPPAVWPLEWAGTIARGGRYSASGGLGIFSAWIIRDEFCARSFAEQRRLIFDSTPIKGRTAMGYRKPDSPRHFFIEDGFGAVAHELAHALGLPHDTRQDAHDIMGQGFRRIRYNFAEPPQPENGGVFSEENIRMLMSSRFLATDLDLHDLNPPHLRVRIVAAKLDKNPASVTIEVEASDDRGLRAALFYCKQQDSVVGGRWLSGTRQAFREELAIESPATGEVAIDATVTDIGGNYVTKRASWPA